MRVSTKGRYALRMMIEFGLNPDQCTKISQVAARQGISDKYLEQNRFTSSQSRLCPEYPAEPRAAICLPESRRDIPSA